MDVHPTKNVSIGIDPYPSGFALSLHHGETSLDFSMHRRLPCNCRTQHRCFFWSIGHLSRSPCTSLLDLMYPDILLILRLTASDATTCPGNISYFDWLETLALWESLWHPETHMATGPPKWWEKSGKSLTDIQKQVKHGTVKHHQIRVLEGITFFLDLYPSIHHWIGLRENLQETMVFTIKYRAFL